jgi:antitoxin component of MazEF toxin-antitoxin module
VVFFLYMARRKLEERDVRKLRKNSGGTVLVSIPIELVRELKWRDGQKVVVKKRGEGISIVDWKK